MNSIKTIAIFIAICFSSLINAQEAGLENERTDVPVKDSIQILTSTPDKTLADSAYVNGDFATAASIYEQLLAGDKEAAELYYNLGNSYYKSGDIGRSILNYERALLLNPGDQDARFNLKMAQAKTIDKVEDVPEIFFISWGKSLINMQSANSWAVCGIVFFVLFIVALYFFIFSKNVNLKKIGFFSGAFFLIVVISANLFAAYQKGRLENRDSAIIMQPSVTVRSTPSESGTALFLLHEGHKVGIKDNSMKSWKEIKLEDGKVGWVPATAIEVI